MKSITIAITIRKINSLNEMKFRIKYLSIFIMFFTISSSAQELEIFNHELYEKSMTLCEALEEFKLTEDFKFVGIGKNLNSLVVEVDDHIFKSKSFVLIKDTLNNQIYQLNQIGTRSNRLPISERNFLKLKLKIEELIKHYKSKLGEPTKTEINEYNFWKEAFQKSSDKIIMAVWDKNEVKFKLEFTITGDEKHHPFAYELRISKFKDYYGNMELPPWWNGYE